MRWIIDSHKTPNHKTSRRKYILYELGGHKIIKEKLDMADFIKIKISVHQKIPVSEQTIVYKKKITAHIPIKGLVSRIHRETTIKRQFNFKMGKDMKDIS